MINKSALRTTCTNVLKDHDIDNRDVVDDLIAELTKDFGGEIYDDDDEEDEPEEA
jgi:hypothetical protein